MRLFLLPISTRRTLIYCERIQESLTNPNSKPPVTDRITNFASTTWANWEKAPKGWQKQVTVYGNRALKRIPYEEWGLKSIPPRGVGDGVLECLYPGAFVPAAKVRGVLRTLATERQALHRRMMWTCIAWTPVTIPFQIVPIIPNIPFYYAAYRAWSHYRALYGGKMLEQLVETDRIKTTDSSLMDSMYAAGLLNSSRETTRAAKPPTKEEKEWLAKQFEGEGEEKMLLQRWNGKLIAEAFHLPEMEVEIERAVEQVEDAIKKAKDASDQKIPETPKEGTVAAKVEDAGRR